ncbi:MAG: hypothetical protein B7Z73_06585 [Planctomycetia bacterium 21-64-5]|nr:MAG: hypothetical protein B7Z73_06585 [Planctomycetia bacterium 21-64-5]HQU43415.1 hypothetical protein [Pirellulales bacterium]
MPGEPTAPPKIYTATFGTGGDVVRGRQITEAEAVRERQSDHNVVVCGQNLADNYDLAEKIETAANGNCKPCPPHSAMGPGALPHFQPDPRGMRQGHTFYETAKRKSKKPKTS